MAKKYTKQTWIDEQLVEEAKYRITDDNQQEVYGAAGIELASEVAVAGSPVNADRMNHIEDGIDDIDDAVDQLETDVGQLGGDPYNYLINGGFDFAQRQTPGTLTTIATDKYSADRWRTSSQSASLQYQRADGTGEAGLTSQYFGAYKQITNPGKFMVYQILEGADSIHLRGKTITFQCQMKANENKTIRMAIIELQNAGTIDTIPATFVTNWNANEVDPTLGANLAIITGAESKSVTTEMQTFSVTITVPSNSKNIICAVWTNSQFSANDMLHIAEAGLYVGENLVEWRPRLLASELMMCYRYYERQTAATGMRFSIGVNDTTTTHMGMAAFLAPKLYPPAVSLSAVGDFTILQHPTARTVTGASFAIVSTQRCTTYFTHADTLTANVVSFLRAGNDNAALIMESEL